MHPRRPRPREYAALPPVLTLTLLLAACGGATAGEGDGEAPPTPTALSAQTASPTPSAAVETEADTEDADGSEEADASDDGSDDGSARSAEPEVWATFTEKPGPLPPADAEEVFGDDPRVQAVRAFNEEFARAATAGDPQRAELLALIDPEGYDALMDYLGEEFGKNYPGPLPFSLLDVTDGAEDGTASVQGCIISSGFALGPEGMTGQSVTSIEYALVLDPAVEGWLVEAIWAGDYDCSTVTVEARAW